MKLYQLTDQYHNALTELAIADIDQEIIDNTLEGLKGDIEVKSKQVAAFIMNRQAEIVAVKEASKKLSERASKESKALDRLVEYLKFNMEANGITEVRSPELILKIRKCPKSVVIDDESKLPAYLLNKPAVGTPDKKAIKTAINSGKTVEGAHLESSTSLSIK